MIFSRADWKANLLLMLWSVWLRAMTFTRLPLMLFQVFGMHRTHLSRCWPFSRWSSIVFQCWWFLSFSARCYSSSGYVFPISPLLFCSSLGFCHYMLGVDDRTRQPDYISIFFCLKWGSEVTPVTVCLVMFLQITRIWRRKLCSCVMIYFQVVPWYGILKMMTHIV